MSPQVLLVGGAFAWRSGFVVDGDGSPRCYSFSGDGLDYLANAGHPGAWYGVVCNASGVPVEQGPNDPAPGFLVSPTSLHDPKFPAADPRRYVNAEIVPYLAVPPELRNRGVMFGDVAMVFYRDRQCAAIVADGGPHNHYGEGSIALAEALGIPSSPKHGGVAGGVTWVLFPGTTLPWPQPIERIRQVAQARFDEWGGVARAEAALEPPAVA